MACVRQSVVFSALAATVLVAGLSQQSFPVCHTSCCTVLPSCSAALRVSCNCSGLSSMSLQKGDIPKTVLSLSIGHVKELVVHKDAVSELTQLTNFSLRFIDRVKIKGSGMALRSKSRLRSVKFEDIGEFRIDSAAFSGNWETKTSIIISRVSKLHVEPKALTYASSTAGPSLDIRRVGMLHLRSEGLMAPLYYLKLDNVIMRTCHRKSFHGKFENVTLNRVEIGNLTGGCFRDMRTLSIRSSSFETVSPNAFTGDIHELRIEDTSFKSIQERGFNIRTQSMQIVRSRIEQLLGYGMFAIAKNKLRLKDLRINILRKNALAGLRILPSTNGFAQSLELSKLDMWKTENSSLAFFKCVPIQVSELSVVEPLPRVCPTERWVRQLTGADPTGELNAAQYEIFVDLFARRLCPEDNRIPMPQRKPSSRCESQVSTSDDLYPDHDDKWYEYAYTEEEREGVREYADWQDRQGKAPLHKGEESHAVSRATETTTITVRISRETATSSTSSVTVEGSNNPVDIKRHESELLSGEHEDKRDLSDKKSVGEDISPEPELREGTDSVDTEPVPEILSQNSTATSAEEPETEHDDETPSETTDADLKGLIEQHQLLVFLTLGTVLWLAFALLLALLVLFIKRRRSRRNKSPPASRGTGVLDLTADLPRPSTDSERTRTTSGGSAYSSLDGHQYEQLDGHQYEPIRESSPGAPQFPAPPPPLPMPIYHNYHCGDSRSQGQEYESLLNR